jgi:hypothetical protein
MPRRSFLSHLLPQAPARPRAVLHAQLRTNLHDTAAERTRVPVGQRAAALARMQSLSEDLLLHALRRVQAYCSDEPLHALRRHLVAVIAALAGIRTGHTLFSCLQLQHRDGHRRQRRRETMTLQGEVMEGLRLHAIRLLERVMSVHRRAGEDGTGHLEARR